METENLPRNTTDTSNRIGPTHDTLAPLIFGSLRDMLNFIEAFNTLNEGASE